MNEQIAQLQEQITEIQQKLDSLVNSSDIPRNLEKAFRTRLGDIKPNAGAVAVTAIGGTDPFNLPNTTGLLSIVVNGKNYNVLYQ